MMKIKSNDCPQLFLWFLFLLTIILTFSPFFKIGLTNRDDVEFYLTAMKGGLFTDAYWYATSAGRFYFLITKPLYHIAYLVDHFYFTKIIQYGFALLSFVLFAVVVKKIFKQTFFALLVFLFLFVFLTVTPNYYMPVIAFPLFFTLSFSIFLLSILFLIKYYETKKYKNLVFSVVLSAVSLLFYENYLIFILFVVVFIFSKNISEQGITFFKKEETYKEVLPFVCTCFAYVAVYFLYRMYVQTENGFYSGSTIAKDFSFDHFFQFIWNPNRAALPTFVYHYSQTCIESNSLLAAGHQHNFWYILKNSQNVSIINASIQCFLFCVLSVKVKPTISWKKVGIGALTAFAFMFAVNFIIGMSDKYNAMYYTMRGYVTTYYSYFCVTILIVFLVYACLKLGYQNRYIKAIVVAFFAFLFFCISIIIGYSNDHLSRDWQHCHAKHSMMEKLIEKGVFDEISDNDIVYTGNFNQTSSILGRNIYPESFWTNYIRLKTNRKQTVITNFENLKNFVQENTEQKIYCITKYETPKSLDVLCVLSKINRNSIDFGSEDTVFAAATANEATVYYYSANKDFIFQFIIPQSSPEATVMIDNNIRKASCGINAIRIENNNKKMAVVSFTLKSDDPFLVKSFAISNIGFVNEKTVILYDN